MHVKNTRIPGVRILTPERYIDSRGYFSEVFNADRLQIIGIDMHFVQDNVSYSRYRNIVRALHFQHPPFAQTKLVRVGRGAVIDVVVDLRHGSPTYGQHIITELSAENGQQVFVPKGCAHGILTIADNTELHYKVDYHYAPEHDTGVIWNDPDLGIAWPTSENEIILSERDKRLPRFRDLPRYFDYP